jgi:hypothetical protein
MYSGKIRGIKRRQKDLNSWSDFHQELDIDRLKEYGYVYAKTKFGPWADLCIERPYPSDYRKQLFSNLINFYFKWKNALDKEFDNYYLKIWLSYPRFIDSQIVVAIGDKIDYYTNLFEKCDNQREFPLEVFNTEKLRINLFDWVTHYDRDYYLERNYLNLELEDNKDTVYYYEEKRFYNRLIKNGFPYKMIDHGNGEERLFYIQQGYIWVGELKK